MDSLGPLAAGHAEARASVYSSRGRTPSAPDQYVVADRSVALYNRHRPRCCQAIAWDFDPKSPLPSCPAISPFRVRKRVSMLKNFAAIRGARHDKLQQFNVGTSTTAWDALPSPATLLGCIVAFLLLALAIVCRAYALAPSTSTEGILATIVGLASLLLATLVVLFACGRYSLRYTLDSQILTVHWLWMRETIPLAGIEAIFKGGRLGDKVRVKGVVWQGYQVGVAEAEGVGHLKFFGTSRDPSAAIIVTTAQRAYAITPKELEGFRSRLIEHLESIPEGETAHPPETHTSPPYLPPISPLELRGAMRWAASVALLAAVLWGILQLPMDVPDTSSPPSGNGVGTANNWAAVGQTFVPSRNGLDRVSVVLAVEQPTDQAAITFNIKATPLGEPLRTIKEPISALPKGKAGDMRPGTLAERWYSFDFEPIADSAGRRLYFSVEGKDVPRENTVNVLMMYHNGYPLGEAYANEKPLDAHLVFRTYSHGRLADMLTVLASNLAHARPGILGYPGFYLALLATYGLLAAAVIRLVRRIATHNPE